MLAGLKFFLLFLFPFWGWAPSPKINISVTVNSTANSKGSIRLGVFADAHTFAQDKSLASLVFPLPQNSSWPATVQLPALLPGTYAIAAFHDLNNNGKLDRNFLGIPIEPYGFIRPPASKWRAPRWDEISFDLTQGLTNIAVNLRDWKQY